MNDAHDLLAARISGWLSGELDPPAARFVGRLVDRDAAARRLAGGYHRVDTIVRDWYEALPTEPAQPVAMPRRANAGPRWRPAAAAAGLLLVVVALGRIDTAQAVEQLFDAAAQRIMDDGDRSMNLAPMAHWRLRAAACGEIPGAGPAAGNAATNPAAG